MAESIKLFQFFQKFHQLIGICSQLNQKRFSIFSRKIIFLFCCTQLILTTIAYLALEAKSMFDFGFGFFIIIGNSNGIVVYLISIWQLDRTLTFIGNVVGFIEKRKQSVIAYRDLIQKIEQFNKYFCIFFCVSVAICIFLPLPYSVFRYFSGMEGNSYYLYAPSTYPFDWKTPAGYLVAFLAQAFGILCGASAFMQFLNLFFGSCWLFTFIAEDITKDSAAFNTAAKATNRNCVELMSRFCDMLQIYSDAKECVKEFIEIYKYPLLSFFTWNLLGVSSLLVTLQFELWADDSDLLEILVLCYLILFITSFIFVLCEPSHFCAKQFEAFGDELDRCDWYLLPIELQRMYVIFLSDTQNPIIISSYGNITCERETSKKIIHKAFSYFMTFRNFRE